MNSWKEYRRPLLFAEVSFPQIPVDPKSECIQIWRSGSLQSSKALWRASRGLRIPYKGINVFQFFGGEVERNSIFFLYKTGILRPAKATSGCTQLLQVSENPQEVTRGQLLSPSECPGGTLSPQVLTFLSRTHFYLVDWHRLLLFLKRVPMLKFVKHCSVAMQWGGRGPQGPLHITWNGDMGTLWKNVKGT